jgi:urease accessory protein
MAVGGVMGAVGVPVPSVEIGIATSAIVLGVMVASVARPPRKVVMTIVGVFAIFHGHAHGTELPDAVNPLAYGAGFVTTTGLLHLTGILLGLLIVWPLGERAIRLGGALIAVGGGWFPISSIGVLA